MRLTLFLGGTTEGSWRDDLIPLLNFEGIKYFDPKNFFFDKDIPKDFPIKKIANKADLFVFYSNQINSEKIKEILESSKKNKDKTILHVLPSKASSKQLDLLNELKQKLIYNKSNIASSLFEIPYIVRGIELGEIHHKYWEKVSKLDKIFNELESSIKVSKNKLSYEEIFDQIGISDYLSEIYINVGDLGEDYTKILFRAIKEFIQKPLFKDINLNNLKDLKFIRETDYFKEFLDDLFKKIKLKLSSKKNRLEKIIEKLDPKSVIDIDELISQTKIDKISIMLILSDLKEDKKIYDFNGRELTLK